MNKFFLLLVLLCSTTGTLFAQSNVTNTEKTFEPPSGFAHRRFTVDLGNGNKMQIELVDMQDLNRFANMDSVLKSFLADLELLRDSLGDELQSRRIDCAIDSVGRKMIRIRKHQPEGTSFLVRNGDAAALKLEQDTVHFTGTVKQVYRQSSRRPITAIRHHRVSLFVNDLSQLQAYTDGRLNKIIRDLQQNINSTWNTTAHKGKAFLAAQPAISAKRPKGFVAGGDYLNLRMSVDLQNYKNYFVPSFSLGAGIIISDHHFKRDLILSWEPNFFFGTNTQGRLRTFRNDFITLTAGQGPIRDEDPTKESHFITILSLGYLVKRDGDYFEKHTLRLGAGRLSLFGGKTKIEPALYFTDLFKKTTPGLRWIQSF